jgi:hypothetical protein
VIPVVCRQLQVSGAYSIEMGLKDPPLERFRVMRHVETYGIVKETKTTP